MQTMLVTGATGTVGARVVQRLSKHEGIVVRAGARSTSKGASANGAIPTLFDFEKPETMAGALHGVDTAFLLAPTMRDQVGASARFIEAAKAAGVRRIVKLSALGCDDEPTIAFGRDHHAVEKLLAASGLGWTALRPNNFMDNFLGLRHGTFAPNAQGDIALPWGNAACSFIAADDIAAAAVAVLTTDGHDGKTYDVTGPEALRLEQTAAIIAAVAKRPIRYVDIPEEVARQKMLAARMPPPAVEAVLELHALGRAGRAAAVTSAVEELTKHPPRTFATFASEHKGGWS
jgi:uncharacterized protein YbjT (DUF2867 family)